MKKLLLVLFLMSQFVTSYSADYAGNFAGYRAQVKNAFDVSTSNSTWVTDTVLNDLIRQGIIAVSPIIQARKKTYVTTTTYRVGTYNLDSAVVGVTDVYWSKNDSLKTLVYAPKEKWYQVETGLAGVGVGYNSRPSYYDWIDGKLFLYPVPARNGDTIKYEAYCKVSDISAKDSLLQIPQVYRTAVIDYVVYRVALSKQSPLLDAYYRNYVESIQNINNSLNSRGIPVEKVNP